MLSVIFMRRASCARFKAKLLVRYKNTPRPSLLLSRNPAFFSTSPINSETDSNSQKTRKIFRFILKSLRPDDWKSVTRIFVAMGFLIASKVIAVTVPFYFKDAVDSLNLSSELLKTTGVVGVVPLALLIGWGTSRTMASFFYEARAAVFAPVAQKAVRSLTGRTFEHLHQMDFSYLLTRSTGALSRTLDRGQSSLNYIINSMIFNIFPTIFEIALVCGLLGKNCGIEYAMVSLVTIIIYSVFTLIVTKWRTQLRKELNKLDNIASSKAVDTFINFETIKFFNNERFEAESYKDRLWDYHQTGRKVQSSLFLLNWGQNFIFTCGLMAVMIMAANGVVAGSMTVGDLVMVNGLLFQLSNPLHFIGSTYREIKQSLVDLNSMISLLNIIPEIREEKTAAKIKFKEGSIAFKNVTFGFRTPNDVLNDLSFEAPCGKSVAIVGLSGSGKSTLLRLMYRFFNPSSGSITIDGHDISAVSLNSVRRAIGVVPQEVVLFNNTIFYNILYGNTQATPEEVYSAAKKARIHESILKMPDGYETQVGERGVKISGGEKQRIAIARMILKNPRIILCDEATSALDVDTESAILDSIKDFARDKTSIYIAHRLGAISDVDTILVMDNGRVVEKGSYYSLMSIPNGRFKRMWEKQARGIKGL